MDIIQYEVGRQLRIEWDTDSTYEALTGATLSGVLESIPGPDYTIRPISGELTVVSSYTHAWTLHYDDTYLDGPFTAQFKAVVGDNIYFTKLLLVNVQRSVEWP